MNNAAVLVIRDEVVLCAECFPLLNGISKIGRAKMFSIESTNAVYLQT